MFIGKTNKFDLKDEILRSEKENYNSSTQKAKSKKRGTFHIEERKHCMKLELNLQG